LHQRVFAKAHTPRRASATDIALIAAAEEVLTCLEATGIDLLRPFEDALTKAAPLG
jgi:hypothetical protein